MCFSTALSTAKLGIIGTSTDKLARQIAQEGVPLFWIQRHPHSPQKVCPQGLPRWACAKMSQHMGQTISSSRLFRTSSSIPREDSFCFPLCLLGDGSPFWGEHSSCRVRLTSAADNSPSSPSLPRRFGYRARPLATCELEGPSAAWK